MVNNITRLRSAESIGRFHLMKKNQRGRMNKKLGWFGLSLIPVISLLAGCGAKNNPTSVGGTVGANVSLLATLPGSQPMGLAVDGSGNVYAADAAQNQVWKITSAGVASVVATGFSHPNGVVVDAAGNVYVADTGNSVIKKIPAGTTTSIVPTAIAFSQTFQNEQGLAINTASNTLYVADTGNLEIKEMNLSTLVSTTVNTGGSANLSIPSGLVYNGGNLYIASSGNDLIDVMATTGSTTASLFAGIAGTATLINASLTSATFHTPNAIAADGSGNLYVADSGNNSIRKISGGTVSTFAGSLTGMAGNSVGAAANALFTTPSGIAVDGSGNVYIADTGNGSVKKYTP
jgi:sugar lactone lactonase YvrE